MYPLLSTVFSISTFSVTLAGCLTKKAKKPKKPPPVLEQAKPEEPIDRKPQLNVPFVLVYNILKCFDRRELCHLRNVNRRHYIVIERKFGISPPYLVFDKQYLSWYSWRWWPASGQSSEQIPSDVRDQLPTSKFVRFKSSEFQLGNPNESNIDVLSMSHVWENQELTLSCASNFAWNEEWTHVAAKAKYLVLEAKGLIPYLRQLTSGNCVRVSLTDRTYTLDTVELPWDHILGFLLQSNSKDAKCILICTTSPLSRSPLRQVHQVEIPHFLQQVKQKFLDSPDSIHFTFDWDSMFVDNPITFDRLDASNNGPVFDDFIVQNRRTQQRLRFHSTLQKFRLAVDEDEVEEDEDDVDENE